MELHAVLMVARGMSCQEVSRFWGDSGHAVADWVRRLEARGIEGLREEERPGASQAACKGAIAGNGPRPSPEPARLRFECRALERNKTERLVRTALSGLPGGAPVPVPAPAAAPRQVSNRPERTGRDNVSTGPMSSLERRCRVKRFFATLQGNRGRPEEAEALGSGGGPPAVVRWKCGNRALWLWARFPSAVETVGKSVGKDRSCFHLGAQTFPPFPGRGISTALKLGSGAQPSEPGNTVPGRG